MYVVKKEGSEGNVNVTNFLLIFLIGSRVVQYIMKLFKKFEL